MNLKKSFTDFHSHILPGIDDGAENKEKSAAMLRSLFNQGVRDCVLSPHFIPSQCSIQEFVENRKNAYEDLLKVYDAENMPKIYLGAEVYLTKNLTKSDLHSLCIADSDVILIELPERDLSHWMIEELEQLLYGQKIVPLIAHVDRVIPFYSEEHLYELFSFNDFIFQINNEAFLSFFMRRKLFSYFGDGDIPCVLGSDSHDLAKRRPNFDRVLKTLDNSKYQAFCECVFETSKELLGKFS